MVLYEDEEITIRKYDSIADDDSSIVDFFSSTYPSGWRSEENWNWLFHKNPYKQNILIIAENKNKDIVSAMHTMPLYIKICDKIFLCFYGTDGAVHKEYRKKGIFNKMVDIKDKLLYDTGAELQYSHTSNPILIRQYSENRIKFPFTLKYFTYIDDVSKHVKNSNDKYKIIRYIGIEIYKKLNMFLNKINDKNHDNEIIIDQLSNFNDEFDGLWNEISIYYDFILKKDSTYLNWRYVDPSGEDYVIKEAKIKNKLIGYVVLNINHNGESSFGYIIDLLVHPNYKYAEKKLLKESIKYFIKNEVNIISTLVIKKQPLEKIYKSLGFIETNNQAHVFILHKGLYDKSYKGLEKEIKEIQSSSQNRKHFSMGDLFIN